MDFSSLRGGSKNLLVAMRDTLFQRPRHMAKEGPEALTERKCNKCILLYRYLWDRLSSPKNKETLYLLRYSFKLLGEGFVVFCIHLHAP